MLTLPKVSKSVQKQNILSEKTLTHNDIHIQVASLRWRLFIVKFNPQIIFYVIEFRLLCYLLFQKMVQNVNTIDKKIFEKLNTVYIKGSVDK